MVALSLRMICICSCLMTFILPLTSNGAIWPHNVNKSKLIEGTSKILCSFKLQTVHVYFENQTAMNSGEVILSKLNDCGTSCYVMRSKYRSASLHAVKHDSMVMCLLMLIHNASQPVDISIIKKRAAAKRHSYVLLIIEDSDNVTSTWLRETFEKFWNIWFPQVAVLFWRSGVLQAFRYDPYENEFLIQIAFAEKLPIFKELFPTLIPNMNLKPLRMCLYHDDIRAIFHSDGHIDGSDGLLSDFIASRLNATRIVDRQSIYGYENNTAEVCFGEIESALDDVAMNTRFLAPKTFYKRVEYTIVHSRDDLCVMVPKANTASIFWNLFRSYSKAVWGLILLSLLFAYGFCVTFYRQLCLKHGFLLKLFGAGLTMPFQKIPVRFSLRIFLFGWMLYGMLICGAYKGTLTSNLVFLPNLPDINTIRDLALSPHTILMFARHVKHLEFLDIDHKYEYMVRSKTMVVPDAVLLDHIAGNNLSYAYLEKRHVARYQANERLHSRYGRPLFHVMKNCLVPFHAVFIVPYGSPYLGYINRLIRSSQEFGFDRHWEGLTDNVFIKSGRKIVRNDDDDDDDPVVLKVAHFQAAFCLWFFGLTTAFLVLLGEKFGPRSLKYIKKSGNISKSYKKESVRPC